jgi:hypothetical protein
MEEESLKAYEWYMEEKRRKAAASKVLRVLSIAGLTLGTVTPALSILSGGTIPAESGYVVLGSPAAFCSWIRDSASRPPGVDTWYQLPKFYLR